MVRISFALGLAASLSLLGLSDGANLRNNQNFHGLTIDGQDSTSAAADKRTKETSLRPLHNLRRMAPSQPKSDGLDKHGKKGSGKKGSTESKATSSGKKGSGKKGSEVNESCGNKSGKKGSGSSSTPCKVGQEETLSSIITVIVYEDSNGNGIQEKNERLLPDVIVSALDGTQYTTNANGAVTVGISGESLEVSVKDTLPGLTLNGQPTKS
eukprot:841629-Ditylum_brightwellii.AAC.1